MVMKLDPYGVLMINRGNRILIVFHLFAAINILTLSISFCHVNILFENIIQSFLCISSLYNYYIYDWITIKR